MGDLLHVTPGFGARPFLDYDKGMFNIWGDPGVTYQSKDAKTGTVVPGPVQGID